MLVIDQFEELFTLCRDEADRRALVDNLMCAVGSPSPEGECRPPQAGPTLLVIALRADFYAHCAQYANLRAALATQQEYIGPTGAEELRRAIEEPARRGKWELEAGLVEMLLHDVGDEPGALPLLSHALLATWQRLRGRALTLIGYAAAAGVHGAIAETAESVFNDQLNPDQQAIARNVFLRLTELGEGTQDSRRRALLTELMPRPEDEPAVEAVLQRLADARLITITADTAEVAHEALIREWPALRGWLDENRDSLRLRCHLTQAAQAWDKVNQDPGELYRGPRLAQALEWAEGSEHVAEPNALEREYLLASQSQAERNAAEREAQRQRELEAARTLAQAQHERA